MASTVIRGAQIKDSTVQRHDLDTSTVGQAVVTKIVQGSGINLSSTGADSGTGDVTVAASAIPLANSAQSGLLNQTSGNTTDFIDGTNNSQPLQPVIWSVRLRSFNAVGNPTFEVDQRNCHTSSAAPPWLCDRWRIFQGGTMAYWGATAASTTLVPGTNFQISNYVGQIQLTTVQTSLGATDMLRITQFVEGPCFRELASDVHSFQIMAASSVANLKFGVAFSDPTGSRSLTKLCSLGAANTAVLFQFPNLSVFPGAGTFTTAPGSNGLILSITLAAGSTYTSPANDTWQNGNFVGAVGQSNFAGSPVNSTFSIYFLQHEPGALCTTPIDCPFGQNLDGPMGCLRYFCKSYDYGTKAGTVTANGCVNGNTIANQHLYLHIPFKRTMAKVPTITGYNPNSGAVNSVRDLIAAIDRTINSALTVGDSSFGGVILATQNASPSLYQFHYTGDTGW